MFPRAYEDSLQTIELGRGVSDQHSRSRGRHVQRTRLHLVTRLIPYT